MSTKKSVKKTAKKSTKASVKKTMGAAATKHAKTPKRAVAKVATRRAPPAKGAARKATVSKAGGKSAAIASAADFMVHAYAMEAEAAERYAEFADSMEMHNNLEVAELFRKLSRIEQRHADQILEQMGWKRSPVSSASYRWEGIEGPETATRPNCIT